jgi:very-short-patch-repair endonuclease
MTDAEKKLWALLRGAQLGGFSFRRQHPVGRFIVDFYCAAAKLIVEVDGGQHGRQRQRLYDRARTAWLGQRSSRVLRFWNDDVLKNPDGVLRSIAVQLASLTQNDPHPTSPL